MKDETNYREEIMRMVQEIENEDYLFKIYHYIIAKYRREKGAKNEQRGHSKANSRGIVK